MLETQKRWRSNPENRAKYNEYMKKYNSRPENKLKRREYDAKRYKLKKEIDSSLSRFLGDFSSFY